MNKIPEVISYEEFTKLYNEIPANATHGVYNPDGILWASHTEEGCQKMAGWLTREHNNGRKYTVRAK